jgi:hypothetical protein
MAHGTLRAIGGDGIDLTVNLPNFAQAFFDSRQSFGLDAIVIREQNDHRPHFGKEAGSGQGRRVWSAGSTCFQRLGYGINFVAI